jgi:inosine/xanthosine triphosphatase
MPTSVWVASENPVKTGAAGLAYSQVFPGQDYSLRGLSVPSDVRAQPMCSEETLEGAANRMKHLKATAPQGDFWVSIEGGIQTLPSGEMEAFAWVLVENRLGIQGKSKTGTFYLPTPVCQLIAAGKELGEADDLVFGHTNSKQGIGSVGILTHGLIDRKMYYVHACILAFIPFVNPALYA